MNVARADLKRLRMPLATAVVLVVAGAACVIISEYQLARATSERDVTRQDRIAAQSRVAKFSEEERELRDNLVYFEQMRQRGMAGEQNRLDWIDSIAKIKKDRKLFEIRYSFEAQKPLDYPGIVPTKAAEFVVSRLKVNMMMLHEGDLLLFLSDLRAILRAHVAVRKCSVDRVDRGASVNLSAAHPHLRAECLIDLVSVRGSAPS